jgi:hypothetical protein
MCVFAACQAVTAQKALALGSDTVFISANVGLTYDSNLFRLDSGVIPTLAYFRTTRTLLSTAMAWV